MGSQAVTVKGQLNGATRTTATTVTVSVGDSSDSATEGTDYQTVDDLTLTIQPNQASGTQTFTLRPENDSLDEGDETLEVSGTSDLPVDPATLTIVDDDGGPRPASSYP